MKDYYLGLDLGTSSVGWAVTDEEYNLIRFRGKDLWGVRTFEEAKTAADRRLNRTSRRRRKRELARIGHLKEYFHDEIFQVDANFYHRLDNSRYHLEDKDENVKSKNILFNDANYTDAEYFDAYPTIFHLRKDLLEKYDTTKHDVRHLYLALLNMFKNRGHFLSAGLGIEDDEIDLSNLYCELNECLEEHCGFTLPTDIDTKKIEEILSNKKFSRTIKKEKLMELMSVNSKEKQKVEFIKAICGLKTKIVVLFPEYDSEEIKKLELLFNDFNYEEKILEVEQVLSDDCTNIIQLMKQIYDICLLSSVLKGYRYLSESRVAEYDKHKEDLKILKAVFKKFKTDKEYNSMFRTVEDGNYSAYVSSTNSNKKIRRGDKANTREDFYKKVKNAMKDVPDCDEKEYILNEIANETFMPKQRTSLNGVIPNQVHAKEMKRILTNAENDLEFLKFKDESGLTVSERILKLFTFQIPYYVGPLSERSKTGWICRKEKGEVLPWNINEKVDIDKTSENFILNLVRKCSYLNGENVIPKNSMLYQSYCVLNEINNIKVNGHKLDSKTKQDIYTELFETGKRVTRKSIDNFLIGIGCAKSSDEITGIDIQVNSALTTYGKFKAIFGDEIKKDSIKNMIEDIVFYSTIYGESKGLIKKRLEKEYGNVLTKEQIKKISGFKFKDWGRLSRTFLLLKGYDLETGEETSLIRSLWDTNLNLMELINSPMFTYADELEKQHDLLQKTLSEIEHDDLDEYYFSPPVKRMMWQTILIIKELEKALGKSPKRIFVEMSRKPDENKKRTDSRKNKFLALYKNIKDEDKDWINVIENAEENGKLRSKKMYLYLTQKGRCMYTGDVIELSELFTSKYDIDHIYPQHFVKDDSLENNLVLVKKEENGRKSDKYPLEETIYKKQKAFWKSLKNSGLVTDTKYERLMRRHPFSAEDKAGFIARQMVETHQAVKGISTVLKQVYAGKDVEIVYSKASNVSKFRQDNDFPKSRVLNDFHHANDAYLNIVVGNVYHVKFTRNPWNFIRNEYRTKGAEYNLNKMFDWDVVRGSETAWVALKNNNKNATINTVKKVMARNTPLMSRKSFEAKGEIANATLYSAEKAKPENYIPFKESNKKIQDVKKYGGFTSVSTAYYFVVEHDSKKKRIRTIETVPIYLSERIRKGKYSLKEYCTNELKLLNPEVKYEKINVQSLVKKDGFYLYLTGKTGNRLILRNAVNMCLNVEFVKHIKNIEKYIDKNVIDENITFDKNVSLYEELLNKHLNTIYSERPNSIGKILLNGKDKFEKLNIDKQCYVLYQVLRTSGILGDILDLRDIGGSASSGKMLMSKEISDVEELFVINQSVTGIYEKRVNLLG